MSNALDADYKLQSMQESVYLLPLGKHRLLSIYTCIEALTGSIYEGEIPPKLIYLMHVAMVYTHVELKHQKWSIFTH